MNRVWKKFLSKFVAPLLTIAYTCIVVAVSMWSSVHISIWLGGAVLVIWILAPLLALLVRDMWRDAKREVEWENREMMSALKGNKIDY